MSEQRKTLLISGNVQGVSYRATCAEAAQRLAVTGFARNLNDGRVEVVAEGSGEALVALEQWCQQGPPGARVDSVTSDQSSATGEFSGFQVG